MLVVGGGVPCGWALVLGFFTREVGTVMGGLFPLPPERLDEEWRTNPAWKGGQGEWADIAKDLKVAGKPPIGVAALVHEPAHRASIVHAVPVRYCGVTADHAGTCKNVHRGQIYPSG